MTNKAGNLNSHLSCGLGDKGALFNVYIGNRPSIDMLNDISGVRALNVGDIDTIGKDCGNGWRKVFNVYAKLLFTLHPRSFSFTGNYQHWQAYRDNELLQKGSRTALWFSPPEFGAAPGVHIIMGKTYAKSLSLPLELNWLNNEFAVAKNHNLVVCPYFDYRQLSNQKILFLNEILAKLR